MREIKLPGLVDAHVHFRTPGQTHKEDFYTGTKAALAGGCVVILDMPNNLTPVLSLEVLENKIAIAKTQIVCDVGFYFGTNGKNLDEFEKVKEIAMGLKVYLNETTGNLKINPEELWEIYETWPSSGSPILLHAEGEAVNHALKVISKTGKRTHFCHMSTKHDLQAVISAKQNGLPVTCGVTPHHLFLTSADTKRLGNFGRMKPELATEEDRRFLWQNLTWIDVIESDHAPHTKEEKQGEKFPFGVPGLETTLPLLIASFTKGQIELTEIIQKCSTNPTKIFGLEASNATVFVDSELSEIENDNLHTKCGWTPFEGEMAGVVKKVTIGEEIVFEDGKVLVKPGTGKILSPKKT